MATITVDPDVTPRIVTVDLPDVTIGIQELHDLIRQWEHLSVNLSYDKIINAGGKEALGGGNFVGITMTMLNAQLAFAAQPGPSFVQCIVSGGNLVAVDGASLPISAISTTAFTQVIIAQSSSPTLIVKEGKPTRGVALPGFEFAMIDKADHVTPLAGQTITGTVSILGSFIAVTNAIREIGSGFYRINLTAAEMDAPAVSLLFTTALCDPMPITILTVPAVAA